MVTVAGQVLAALLVLTVAFDALDRALKRAAARAAPAPAAGAGMPADEDVADLSSYHPVLQELYALRRRHAETNTPSLFVEHSRLGRKLVKVEAQWKNEVLPNLEPQEKVRHIALLQNDFKAPGRRPDPVPRPVSALLNVPVVTGHRRWLPSVRLAVMYLVIRQIAGWAPPLSQIPMITVPAAVFWPWMSSASGKLFFPLNWLLSPVDSATYVDGDRFLNVPAIPGGASLVSFGFFTSVFIANAGWNKLRSLATSPQSPFRTALLAHLTKQQ